jgi:hypothetical protein
MAGHGTNARNVLTREEGYDPAPSNKSFTLTTPPDHPKPGDSAETGFPVALVTPHSRLTLPSLHAVAALLALVLGAVVALTLTGTAAAATPCGKKILNDWYDNGRVDRLYPLHCYEEAIDAIPRDIRDYADAADVISRALQSALRGELGPGGVDPSPGNDKKRDPGAPAGGGGGDGTSGGSEATPPIDTSGASSVPIPLVVLGGMSLALLAAGGLGYLSRRRQAAEELGDQDDDDGPTLG